MISKQLAELISSIQSDSEKVCKNQKDLQEQDFFPDNEGFATKKSKKKVKRRIVKPYNTTQVKARNFLTNIAYSDL